MIPKLHYISKATTIAQHLDQVQKACTSGIELVQLDLEHIVKNDLLELTQKVQKITEHFQTRLVIKGNYQLAIDLKLDGVYLENNHDCPTQVRKHLYNWQSIGAAAHTLQDCESLLTKDVDYIVLKPFKTVTDKNLNDLDIDGYTAVMEELTTHTPILGSGAITLEDVTSILETGISGITVSNAITTDFNSIKKFHELLNASSTQEMRHTFDKK